MNKLRETYSVIEYDKMSLDRFLIHLFIRNADNMMSKMAQEILEREHPSIHIVFYKIREIKAAVRYNNKKEFGMMANVRPPRYCKSCDSKTHNESEWWGECEHCGQ